MPKGRRHEGADGQSKGLFKIYARDQGVLMSMPSRGTAMSILDGEIPSNLGYPMEICVACLLNNAGISPTHHKRKTAEVEFVSEIDGTVFGIDCKSGKDHWTRSLDPPMERSTIMRGIKLRDGNIGTRANSVECYPLSLQDPSIA